MIEKTIFTSNEEIIKFVKQAYELEITTIDKIDRGSANIFLLNSNKYILKEFQSRYKKEEIDKEIIVINHLRNNEIKVPEYIQALNGEYSLIYKDKTIIIQKYIDGYTLNNNEGNYDQTIECADIYGRIVSALVTLPIKLPSSDISQWYSEESFETSIKKHKELLFLLNENDEIDLKIKSNLEEKLEMIKAIKDTINFSEMQNLTIMNTHGDYNLLQFIYKDGHVAAVIDFVSACQMPIVWELIRSYSYIDSDAKNGEFNLNTFVEYIRIFNKYVKLNKYDLKYMPYIYLIQILNSTFGYKQFVMDRSKRSLLSFGYLRTNICRYLFNNAKIISERLESEI